MVSLFGTRDELLKVIEKGFPSTTIVVRGNEITISGEPSQTETVARLFEELIELMSGRGVSADGIGHLQSWAAEFAAEVSNRTPLIRGCSPERFP